MAAATRRAVVTDPQLVILAEVEGMFRAPDGYSRDEGASQVGLNRRSLATLIEAGLLVRTDTGTSDTEGGRYRLHSTQQGIAELRRAVAQRVLVLPWFGCEVQGSVAR